ncbi:ATP-binding cassette domain-containing protein [Sporosarcina sp. ANT_H38]|uniref:ABC transporter ATP-binding protein/permease n=1 Tax=Sporosarcina sp. ANT_H38 TaxID=2597358 RepID=UPI0011F0E652|nr:ATP-binding cassette domain-containing protein [Sporosarcina sp. ANT_H38]KAA0944226.1 ATP-binding cassette domain-containing protein [Sporosarcina sp. ANT_H38]
MIQIKNITKKYGNSLVLDDVDFTFPNRGLMCLLGASGSGKSTLLNMLAGFDSDYSGDISVCGTSISKMNEDELCAYRRDNIGFIFQNYHLLSGYTVLENIMLDCELNSLNDQSNKENAKELLNRLGISEKANEKIENLSGGQKQRVAIARALISNPTIILADEPTGALDRSNSNEIMNLLKEISKDRLVIVITHDQKVCDFAHEVISIENGKIVAENNTIQADNASAQKLTRKPAGKVSAFKRGLKNFKVHFTRYVAVSLAIAIGVFGFILSLSSGNIMQQSIADFKEKNTAFNNGYIITEDEKSVLKLLESDERIENVYLQHRITDVSLRMDDNSVTMAEKYPMSKTTESMSYGTMPKITKNEIALTPSLAKKFSSSISDLVGKELTLKYGHKEYKLTVSGIYNAGYDDFFVSSDVEQAFYTAGKVEQGYSISYDVKDFEDIVAVSQMLSGKEIDSKNASIEVGALQSTFKSLSRLFLTVSILILAIALFISVVLLVKLQSSRYKELGLLAALGFKKESIQRMVISENILLSAMAAIYNAVLIGGAYLTGVIFDLAISVSPLQIFVSILSTGFVVIIIGVFASYKLIHTDPAVALRK